MKTVSNKGKIEHTPAHLMVHLSQPCRILSSAPFNGGMTDANRLLILKVMDNFEGAKGPFEPLATTFQRYCREKVWTGLTVGMMTSAKMSSFRRVSQQHESIGIDLLVTAGISNARRAGDPAEYRMFDNAESFGGTINAILLTSATLTPAAMVEAVMVITEAKAAVMQDLGIISPVTDKTATGTGTDAIAIVSGFKTPEIAFCGKHTLLGEMLASATMEAISSSLQKD